MYAFHTLKSMKINQRVQIPYGLVAEFFSPLASDKLVRSDPCSEESQTAKTCTEEHEVHRRPMNVGKCAQQHEAYSNNIHR